MYLAMLPSSVFLYHLKNHEEDEDRAVDVIKEAIQVCQGEHIDTNKNGNKVFNLKFVSCLAFGRADTVLCNQNRYLDE